MEINEQETPLNPVENEKVEEEITIDQKGTITAMFGQMQVVFNTLWTKEEFEDKQYEMVGDYFQIPMDKENVRILNLRNVAFLDYGPLQDMEKLREELKKKQEEARAAQNSSIIRPGKHSPVGTRGRMQ